MKALFVNTATKKLIVSIVVDNEIKYLYNEENNNDLSVNLLLVIDEAFKVSKLKPENLDVIFVTVGPGSFTGVRLGLTVVKIMAWSKQIKVVPISSLELMASSDKDKKEVLALIDARRNYVFAGLYDSELNSIIDDCYILLDDLKEKIDNKDVWCVSDDVFTFAVNKPDYDIIKIINRHKDDVGVNPHELKPNYLKNTEAEEKLKGSR